MPGTFHNVAVFWVTGPVGVPGQCVFLLMPPLALVALFAL
jgi:hypothetical protein